MVLQSNNSPKMQNNWHRFLLLPHVSPRTGWIKILSHIMHCLATTLTLFNLKYLTYQIDYRIIYRWVWVQAYGCRSGLWNLQPCEGAISLYTCVIPININGNRVSLLGGTWSPQLSFVLALPGNDGADFQRKQPLLTIGHWSSKASENSLVLVLEGVRGARARKQGSVRVVFSVWLFSCMGLACGRADVLILYVPLCLYNSSLC